MKIGNFKNILKVLQDLKTKRVNFEFNTERKLSANVSKAKLQNSKKSSPQKIFADFQIPIFIKSFTHLRCESRDYLDNL